MGPFFCILYLLFEQEGHYRNMAVVILSKSTWELCMQEPGSYFLFYYISGNPSKKIGCCFLAYDNCMICLGNIISTISLTFWHVITYYKVDIINILPSCWHGKHSIIDPVSSVPSFYPLHILFRFIYGKHQFFSV